MESSSNCCPTCGCSCGYDKKDAAKIPTHHQYAMKTHNLCLEGSASLQCSTVSLSDTFTRTNILSDVCLAADDIQGCSLGVIYNKLNMETLPDGFVCNRISDMILLYKLDISGGLIAIKCGIIVTSDFQVICSSYNEVLPVNIYEDLLSKEKHITRISQLMNLVSRLDCFEQAQCGVKIEPGCSSTAHSPNVMSTNCRSGLKSELCNVSTVSEDLSLRSTSSPIHESSFTIKSLFERSESETTIEGDCESDALENGESDSPLLPTLQISNIITNTEVNAGTLSITRSCSVVMRRLNTRCPVRCDTYKISSGSLRCAHSTSIYQSDDTASLLQEPCDVKDVRVSEGFSNRANESGTVTSQGNGRVLTESTEKANSKQFDESASSSYKISPTCKSCCCGIHLKKKHGQCEHNNGKKYRCIQCEKSFHLKKYLTKHLRHVHGRVYGCDRCSFSSKYSQSLKLHISTVHVEEKLWECSQCLLCFSQNGNLTHHIRSVHNNERPHECSSCHKKCSTRDVRDRHWVAVHCEENPYSCDRCDYKFTLKSNLLRHQRIVHDGVRRYPCAGYQYQSSSKSNLEQNFLAVHYNEKPHKCSLCGKVFSWQVSLKTHIDAVHKGLKPYSCTECNSKFSQKGNLQSHIKAVHRNEKPHSCSVCSKSFSRKEDVKIHVDAVHNFYRHQCQQCSESFSRKYTLNMHVKTKHK